MNSPQTLTTHSSSFPNFQPPPSLPLHYTLESSKSPTLPQFHHRSHSPLQPLNLNPTSTASKSTTSPPQKLQNMSFSTAKLQSGNSYSNSPTKQIEFSQQTSPTVQNPLNSSKSPLRASNNQPKEEQNPTKSKERCVGGLFSSWNYSSIDDGNENTSSTQTSLTRPTGNGEGPEGSTSRVLQESKKDNFESSRDHHENHGNHYSKLMNPFSGATHAKSQTNATFYSGVTASEKTSQTLYGLKENQGKFSLFASERMNSEICLNNIQKNNTETESSFEDSNISRLRASSVGDAIAETREIYNNTNVNQETPKRCLVTPHNHLTDDLIKKRKARQCLNVLCFTSPDDPLLWSKQKVMNSTICKACFDAFKSGQYCFFCYQIYLDQETSASNDGKDWIECDGCNRWNHIECESVHGLKEIRTLLQGHENTYSYFCPNCRNDKVAKAASRRLKAFMTTPSLIKTTSFQKQPASTKKPVRGNPVTKEEIAEEPVEPVESIIEPYGKKLKPNVEPSCNEGSNPLPIEKLIIKQKEKETIANLSPLELTKKKLDSISMKSQINKRRPMRTELLHISEHYADIDKLLSHYSGKRVQLSESEIRADLELFKELSKTSTCHSDVKSNRSDYGMDSIIEDSEDKFKFESADELSYSIRDSKIRLKAHKRVSKKGGQIPQYIDSYALDEGSVRDEDSDKDTDDYEPRRQLRNKKRF